MRRLLLLFISIIALSCSTNDDSENIPKNDPIIGTWKPVRMIEYPSNADEVVTEYETCHQQSRIIFSSDGKFHTIQYYSVRGTCTLVGSDEIEVLERSWSKVQDGFYSIKEITKITSTGEIVAETDNLGNVKFPDSETMILRFQGSYRYDNDETDVVYYTRTYKKVD